MTDTPTKDKRTNITALFKDKRTKEVIANLDNRQTKEYKGKPPRYSEHALTHKQELFCELVADGNTLSDAYRGAYNTANMKTTTINRSASDLMDNQHVAARINSLLQVKESNYLHDAARLRRFVLEGLQDVASSTDSTPSARVSALVALGKVDVVSMFREIKEVSTDNKSAEQLKREIEEKLTRFLAQDTDNKGETT